MLSCSRFGPWILSSSALPRGDMSTLFSAVEIKAPWIQGDMRTSLLSDPSDSRTPLRPLLIYLFTRPSFFTLQGLWLPVSTSFQTMDSAVAPVRWAMVSPHWLLPFCRLTRPPGAPALARLKPIPKGRAHAIQKTSPPWTPRRSENWRCLPMTSRYGGSNWVSAAAIREKEMWRRQRHYIYKCFCPAGRLHSD